MKRDYISRSGLVSASKTRSCHGKDKKGQSVMEYFIILALVLTAILASGLIGRFKGAFEAYRDQAAAVITTGK